MLIRFSPFRLLFTEEIYWDLPFCAKEDYPSSFCEIFSDIITPYIYAGKLNLIHQTIKY